VVRLQINDKIKIVTSSYNYEVVHNASIILMENIYKVDDKYDISQSQLYSVVASFGDYTIISEPNLSPDMVTLYYKSNPILWFLISDLVIDSFDKILFIRLNGKLLVAASRDSFIESHKKSKYYFKHNDSLVNIIDTEAIGELIKSITYRNNDEKSVAIYVTKMTDIVKRVNLKYILEEFIRSYACPDDSSVYLLYTYYVEHDEEKVYILTYFECLERAVRRWYKDTKPKFCLFTCKIAELAKDRNSFRTVKEFELDTDKYPKDIIDVVLNKRPIIGSYGKILRFLSSKWNTGNLSTDLKVFKIYDKSNSYYDFHYNRVSIRVSATTDTSIDCDLHLVRRILPVF
jgi:hypothetical protein